MASLLCEVKPIDPAIFGALALLLTRYGAGLVDSRREAARVDPLVALRYE